MTENFFAFIRTIIRTPTGAEVILALDGEETCQLLAVKDLIRQGMTYSPGDPLAGIPILLTKNRKIKVDGDLGPCGDTLAQIAALVSLDGGAPSPCVIEDEMRSYRIPSFDITTPSGVVATAAAAFAAAADVETTILTHFVGRAEREAALRRISFLRRGFRAAQMRAGDESAALAARGAFDELVATHEYQALYARLADGLQCCQRILENEIV